LIPVCQNEGLGVIPWSPLRGGWLTGKYRRDMSQPPENTRVAAAEEAGWSERWSAYNTARTWNVIDALRSVAAEVGKEPAQVALRWLLQRPGVTAPIIGARTMAHLDSNLGAVGWTLADAQMAQLTEASATNPPYPHGFMALTRGDR
jgi:aryl-alcohol dehydrogenase-like predicted oxidoreductase